MARLLVIPNDSTKDYHRSDEGDFLSEINPRRALNGERYFDSVAFLNWKDELDNEYCGVMSYSILKNKTDALDLMKRLSGGEIPFSSPLFKSIFAKEKDRIIGISKDYNPDIVRAFNSHFAAELGYIVSHELDIPLVVSAHDPSRLTSAINYADSLVCISRDLANKSICDYGADKEKISIIPDGVDMHRLFYPRSSEDYSNIVGNDFLVDNRVLSIGRIVHSKNIETLLRAISKIKDRFSNLKHIHLGKGDSRAVSEIEALRDSLGLEAVSYFLGGISKNNLPFYYSWADVYALPTLWEGFGRAQIEALACSTPVITTNDSPMNDIVSDDYNGFLVNATDSNMLAERIFSLLSDSELRGRMSDVARESVFKYDVRFVMDEHCRNYDKLIGVKGRHGSS